MTIEKAIIEAIDKTASRHGDGVLIADLAETITRQGGSPEGIGRTLLKLHKAQRGIRLQRLDLRDMYAERAEDLDSARIADDGATYDIVKVR